jgi:hypothetical protein
MSRTTRRFFSAGAAALALALTGLVYSTTVHAASISYGNFGPVGPGVSFLNVLEASGTDPVPLYGPPTAFATGLDFNPVGFTASGAGGTADITDGQLNFTIMSPGGVKFVNLAESGNYSLTGVGTPATQVIAGAIIRATVTQINGVNVAPIVLFANTVSSSFNLVANPGVLQPWALGTNYNVGGLLSVLGYNATQKATKVDISIDNQLIAISEPLSSASISKTDFNLTVTPQVPEPATLSLAGLALCGVAALRRRNA